ncbi:carbohydrate kinase family protein [Microbacterium capsulatum]|uniref:Carbohydrate kinase family protein n=1 Tax=Microbacterium capsulatum TaxID=3041921 RepID=A0ABU0XGW0_9MICO|nr:carbohydrate kinase family protein [Microbacterium sp. ASV81]MDQ4214359.1 carbohydrate kinase family protein [Microbacterium sp. ASV81]
MISSGTGREPEAVLLGDLNIDLFLDIPALPRPGGDGVATHQRTGFGGSAANTAVVLQRLGIDVALLACIGDDDWGTAALSGISETGVDTRLVRRTVAEGTSLNVVAVTPDGERTMLAYRGASPLLDVDAVPERFGRHLHLSGYALLGDPQRAAAFVAARRARATGATVSLDVPVDPTACAEELLALLPLVDVLVIGAEEARALTGAGDERAALRALAARGPAVVAMKRGADGALLHADGTFTDLPAPRVDVVDSTGAGDSFGAGLVFALLRGADPGTACAFATACGAAAVAVRGAGASLPGRAEVGAVLGQSPEPQRAHLRALLGDSG